MFETGRRAHQSQDFLLRRLTWNTFLPDEREDAADLKPEDLTDEEHKPWFQATSRHGYQHPSVVLLEEIVCRNDVVKADTKVKVAKETVPTENKKTEEKSVECKGIGSGVGEKKVDGNVPKKKQEGETFLKTNKSVKTTKVVVFEGKASTTKKSVKAGVNEGKPSAITNKNVKEGTTSPIATKSVKTAKSAVVKNTVDQKSKMGQKCSNVSKSDAKIKTPRSEKGGSAASGQGPIAINQGLKQDGKGDLPPIVKSSAVLRRMELDAEGFFEYLFSNRWEEGCLVRVTQGKLLSTLLEGITRLERFLDVISYATMAYIYNRRPLLPCIKSAKGTMKPELVLEKILVELDCFCSQERPEVIIRQLQGLGSHPDSSEDISVPSCADGKTLADKEKTERANSECTEEFSVSAMATGQTEETNPETSGVSSAPTLTDQAGPTYPESSGESHAPTSVSGQTGSPGESSASLLPDAHTVAESGSSESSGHASTHTEAFEPMGVSKESSASALTDAQTEGTNLESLGETSQSTIASGRTGATNPESSRKTSRSSFASGRTGETNPESSRKTSRSSFASGRTGETNPESSRKTSRSSFASGRTGETNPESSRKTSRSSFASGRTGETNPESSRKTSRSSFASGRTGETNPESSRKTSRSSFASGRTGETNPESSRKTSRSSFASGRTGETNPESSRKTSRSSFASGRTGVTNPESSRRTSRSSFASSGQISREVSWSDKGSRQTSIETSKSSIADGETDVSNPETSIETSTSTSADDHKGAILSQRSRSDSDELHAADGTPPMERSDSKRDSIQTTTRRSSEESGHTEKRHSTVTVEPRSSMESQPGKVPCVVDNFDDSLSFGSGTHKLSVSDTASVSTVLPGICNIRGMTRPAYHEDCLQPLHMLREPFLQRRLRRCSAFPPIALPQVPLDGRQPSGTMLQMFIENPPSDEKYLGPKDSDEAERIAPDTILQPIDFLAVEETVSKVKSSKSVKSCKSIFSKDISDELSKDKKRQRAQRHAGRGDDDIFFDGEHEKTEAKYPIDEERVRRLGKDVGLMAIDLVANPLLPTEAKKSMKDRLKGELRAKRSKMQSAVPDTEFESGFSAQLMKRQPLIDRSPSSSATSLTYRYAPTPDPPFNFMKKWDKCPAFDEFYRYLVSEEQNRALSKMGQAPDDTEGTRKASVSETESTNSECELGSEDLERKQSVLRKASSHVRTASRKSSKYEQEPYDDPEKRTRKKTSERFLDISTVSGGGHRRATRKSLVFSLDSEDLPEESLNLEETEKNVKHPKDAQVQEMKKMHAYTRMHLAKKGKSPVPDLEELRRRKSLAASKVLQESTRALSAGEKMRLTTMGITRSGTHLLTEEEELLMEEESLVFSETDKWHISVRFAYLAGGVCDSVGVRNDLLRRRDRIYAMVKKNRAILEMNESRFWTQLPTRIDWDPALVEKRDSLNIEKDDRVYGYDSATDTKKRTVRLVKMLIDRSKWETEKSEKGKKDTRDAKDKKDTKDKKYTKDTKGSRDTKGTKGPKDKKATKSGVQCQQSKKGKADRWGGPQKKDGAAKGKKGAKGKEAKSKQSGKGGIRANFDSEDEQDSETGAAVKKMLFGKLMKTAPKKPIDARCDYIDDSEVPDKITPTALFKLMGLDKYFNPKKLKSSYSFEKMYAHRPKYLPNYAKLLAFFEKPFKKKEKPKPKETMKGKQTPVVPIAEEEDEEEESESEPEPSPSPPLILGKLRDFKFLQHKDHVPEAIDTEQQVVKEMSSEEVCRSLLLAMQRFSVRKERATTLTGCYGYRSKVTLTFTRRAVDDRWMGIPPMADCVQLVAAVCRTLQEDCRA